MRLNGFAQQENHKETKKREKEEENYLNEKLKLIDLQAEADLERARNTRDKLVIDLNKKQAKVDAWTDYAKVFEIGS
ncbi:MAG: hypothetical protein K6G10_11095 [Butyrivibrio sp.]|nr:hypothetical protein [Butyrivibrio sp.]